MTPCPYWDTGCLCIMPTFAGAIGSCIAEKCKGQDVVAATSLVALFAPLLVCGIHTGCFQLTCKAV